MRHSRIFLFLGSIAVSGTLLAMFAFGMFNHPAPHEMPRPVPQIVADDGDGSGTQDQPPQGDPTQGTELQPAEQDEENSEGPG